jgi:hypothetical protein
MQRVYPQTPVLHLQKHTLLATPSFPQQNALFFFAVPLPSTFYLSFARFRFRKIRNFRLKKEGSSSATFVINRHEMESAPDSVEHHDEERSISVLMEKNRALIGNGEIV